MGGGGNIYTTVADPSYASLYPFPWRCQIFVFEALRHLGFPPCEANNNEHVILNKKNDTGGNIYPIEIHIKSGIKVAGKRVGDKIVTMTTIC